MKARRLITLGLSGSLLLGMVAYAASPAQVYSELTGKTEEQAYELRQEGKTYGQLATEEGVYEDFVAKMLEEKIKVIEEKVKDGQLTREEADEFIAKLKDNVGNCDPSNPQRLGQKMGIRLGMGQGQGMGCGKGIGNGGRKGRGQGFGRRVN
ncbi:MAG: hypothetical protein N4A63_17420 [Vallitalea sp.]|jgi:hypothetical protein|nr:hypothetical protein [Vallitalea sp.]